MRILQAQPGFLNQDLEVCLLESALEKLLPTTVSLEQAAGLGPGSPGGVFLKSLLLLLLSAHPLKAQGSCVCRFEA